MTGGPWEQVYQQINWCDNDDRIGSSNWHAHFRKNLSHIWSNGWKVENREKKLWITNKISPTALQNTHTHLTHLRPENFRAIFRFEVIQLQRVHPIMLHCLQWCMQHIRFTWIGDGINVEITLLHLAYHYYMLSAKVLPWKRVRAIPLYLSNLLVCNSLEFRHVMINSNRQE